MFWWKCQSFWDSKCLDLRGLEPPTFRLMPNSLTIWAFKARHLLSYVFEYWFWRYRYIFLSKVNIWNVNCVRATVFMLDVLVKVSKFLRQKMSWPEVLTLFTVVMYEIPLWHKSVCLGQEMQLNWEHKFCAFFRIQETFKIFSIHTN